MKFDTVIIQISSLRGLLMPETHKARTNLRNRCLSVWGVKLWTERNHEIKMSKSLSVFKKPLKCNIIRGYHEL